MKIACTGSSGSGKTTIVKFIAEELGIPHISGSAGDVTNDGDKALFHDILKYPGGGHAGVIRYSALNPEYGWMNQKILQMRRKELIMDNTHFVTDRSPIDNLTYAINQMGYHPMVTDAMIDEFAKDCLAAWQELDYVIYIKPSQPEGVEINHSRVSNTWYQKSIDAQFDLWLRWFLTNSPGNTEVLIINYWNLERRKEAVLKFLNPE